MRTDLAPYAKARAVRSLSGRIWEVAAAKAELLGVAQRMLSSLNASICARSVRYGHLDNAVFDVPIPAQEGGPRNGCNPFARA